MFTFGSISVSKLSMFTLMVYVNKAAFDAPCQHQKQLIKYSAKSMFVQTVPCIRDLCVFSTYVTSVGANQNLEIMYLINSLVASGNFCHLLIIFAYSLDSDQDRHSVCPDLDTNV